jgi:hypothetical protein
VSALSWDVVRDVALIVVIGIILLCGLVWGEDEAGHP